MAVNVLLPLLIPLGEQITNGTGNLYFSKSTYEVYVPENVAPVDLLHVKAHSNTTSGAVTYNIIGDKINQLFSADSSSGKIFLKNPLDYEAQNKYEVIVGAQLGAERAFGRIVVNVEDVNDNPPHFARPLYETQMTEEDDRHLPKSILRVRAFDRDISDRKKLRHYLEGDGVLELPPNPYSNLGSEISDRISENFENFANMSKSFWGTDFYNETVKNDSYFSINQTTGDIQLLRPLDRDAPTGRERWVLRVWATDGLHTAHTTLHVNVKDINDNAPFFVEDIIEGSVPENAPADSEVVIVRAVDLDDPLESSHAILSYSLEKNVIDETTGRPIFTIGRDSGRISTALCCLDREKTSSFGIQVVTTDGGGLKGTGSVLITVTDENDVRPRFGVAQWRLSVHERSAVNSSLAIVKIKDPDLTNDFRFRVVPYSGFGWERFVIIPSPPDGASLRALQPLDYEDPNQKGGFKFKIQVTDKGDDWRDNDHQDTIWTIVSLVDDNDNNPEMNVTFVNLTLSEDTKKSVHLAEFPAADADKDGKGKIFYSIELSSDRNRRFTVDGKGRVSLRRNLDRETEAHHLVKILATDEGSPARTATSSLFVTVTDVNDNPPFIKSPSILTLQENVGPRHLANILMDDPDDWNMNHGPPFRIHLAESASSQIRKKFHVQYKADGDNGRGTGILSSLEAMDREATPVHYIPLVLTDAKQLSATVTLAVLLGDVNDNPMSTGEKTVQVIRIKTSSYNIPLGRVFVNDPDDWDAEDKIWDWFSVPNPNFSLERRTGMLSLNPVASDNKYKLRFSVSDLTHNQKGVQANVTVDVKTLSVDRYVDAIVPVLISSHTPKQLISHSREDRVSPLRRLIKAINSVLNLDSEIVSLEREEEDRTEQPAKSHLRTPLEPPSPMSSGVNKLKSYANRPTASPSSEKGSKIYEGEAPSLENIPNIPNFGNLLPLRKDWMSSDSRVVGLSQGDSNPGSYEGTRRPLDPPTTLWITSKTPKPLDHLLLIHRIKISELSGVDIEDVGIGACSHFEPRGHSNEPLHRNLSSLSSSSSLSLSLSSSSSSSSSPASLPSPSFWVTDANSTALVTPRVWAGLSCSCRNKPRKVPEVLLPHLPSQPLPIRDSNTVVPSCHPNPCFNGGRCVLSDQGTTCICPNLTSGPFCKMLSRTFGKKGWAWVDPIPTCSRAHISLKILTRNPNGVIMYTGPSEQKSHSTHSNLMIIQNDILCLELRDGVPRLLLDVGSRPVVLLPSKRKMKTAKKNSGWRENRAPLPMSFTSNKKTTKDETEEKFGAHYNAKSLSDGKWHRLDLIWSKDSIELLIDLCRGAIEDCHLKSSLPKRESLSPKSRGDTDFVPRTPLQIGGLAFPPPNPLERGWTTPLSNRSLEGCIKELRVNGKLYDIGANLLSSNSSSGCSSGDLCSKGHSTQCQNNHKCEGVVDDSCKCSLGWRGSACETPTTSSYFEENSFVRVALSFLPSNTTTSVDLRFRTWSKKGQLIRITSQHTRDKMSLFLKDGQLCLLLALRFHPPQAGFPSPLKSDPLTLCLSKVALNDGHWHSAHAKRYGQWCELWVDDGDWPLYNASLSSTMNRPPSKPMTTSPFSFESGFFYNVNYLQQIEWGTYPFVIDRQEGIHIGGIPEYVGMNLLKVHDDFANGCIDDVRLNGKPLPLPPGSNTTKWGQATTWGGKISSCRNTKETLGSQETPVCFNISCPSPLICIDMWQKHKCGCESGKLLSRDGSQCEDINECFWNPCFNGGTCFNQVPHYSCLCPRGYVGSNCEFEGNNEKNLNLSLGIVIGVVMWLSFFIVVLAVYAFCHKRKSSKGSANNSPVEDPSLPTDLVLNYPFHATENECPVLIMEMALSDPGIKRESTRSVEKGQESNNNANGAISAFLDGFQEVALLLKCLGGDLQQHPIKRESIASLPRCRCCRQSNVVDAKWKTLPRFNRDKCQSQQCLAEMAPMTFGTKMTSFSDKHLQDVKTKGNCDWA